MERFILFPKNEIRNFNEGKKYFQENHYQKAIVLFEKAINLKYLKKDCIKYLIDCHIELHNFEEVYKMIENEFVDKNVEEEYLLKKYLYTMVLEEQYVEASEIIKIYQQNKEVSNDLKQYLDELLYFIDKKLNQKNNNQENMLNFFLSDRFEDHIQIILNLEKLNVDKYELEIKQFLNNAKIDSFIKYNLLKYLMENELFKQVYYTNYYQEKSLLTKTTFIDVLNDERYFTPIQLVLQNVEHEYSNAKEFIQNIWLDFCIKHYPHLIDEINLGSAVLHVLLLKALEITFNINDVCQLYDVASKRLFYYFDM